MPAGLQAQDDSQGAYFSPSNWTICCAHRSVSRPLLAQVLTASTFPDQIDERPALSGRTDPAYVDSQPWT